jgi:uncharacterized protein (UPF0248 family)
MKIFPVFHISLFLSSNPDSGLLGQKFINEAESKNTKERILIREKGEKEGKKTWKFDKILDVQTKMNIITASNENITPLYGNRPKT